MSRTDFLALRHRRRVRVTIAGFSLIALGILFYFSLNRGAYLVKQRAKQTNSVVSVQSLWNDKRYAELVGVAENRLLSDPVDRDALLFAGYSRYILALSRVSAEKGSNDLRLAIRHLRRLLALEGNPHTERVEYVLGKAYLFKGRYWLDMAVHYLTAAIDAGYEPDDIHEYLGRSYAAMGDADSALKWYQVALEKHPTDRLLLTMGQEAFQLGRYNEAADYYNRALDRSRDDSLVKTGLFQLGKLYYDVGNYRMAKGILERLVNMDEYNVTNMFLLAETLYELGMASEARRLWHAIIRIDPEHTETLRYLYN